MRLRILCLTLFILCMVGCLWKPDRTVIHKENMRQHGRAANEMANEILGKGTQPNSPLSKKIVTSTGLVRKDIGEPSRPLDWENDPAYLASVDKYESEIAEYKVRMEKYEATIGKWKRRWNKAVNFTYWALGIASLFGLGGAGVARNLVGKLKTSKIESLIHRKSLGTMIKASQESEKKLDGLKTVFHKALDKFKALDNTANNITEVFNGLKSDNHI